MANEYYTPDGVPANGAPGSSAAMRGEFTLLGTAFNKLPALAGMAGTIVCVNAGGTALTNLGTTGSGNAVLATSPTLITPNLGTPSAGVLTNCTGLPNAGLTNSSITIGSTAVSLGGTAATIAGLTLTSPVLGTPSSGTLTNCTGLPISSGVSGLGTGVASALAGSVTGSGTLVLASAPTLTNPIVGTQSASDNSTKAASTAYVDALFASGTWTPTDGSGATLTFTTPVGYYRRTGNEVTVWGSLTYPSTANGSNAQIGGLPFTSANLSLRVGGFVGTVSYGLGAGNPGSGTQYEIVVNANSTNIVMRRDGGTQLTNANLSTFGVDFCITYPI